MAPHVSYDLQVVGMEGLFGVIFMSVVSIMHFFVHVLVLEYPKMMINEYI